MKEDNMRKENIDGLGTRGRDESDPGSCTVASIVVLVVGIVLFIIQAYFEW